MFYPKNDKILIYICEYDPNNLSCCITSITTYTSK